MDRERKGAGEEAGGGGSAQGGQELSQGERGSERRSWRPFQETRAPGRDGVRVREVELSPADCSSQRVAASSGPRGCKPPPIVFSGRLQPLAESCSPAFAQ